MPEQVPGQAEAEAKYGPKLPPAVQAQVVAAEQHYQQPPPQDAPPAPSPGGTTAAPGPTEPSGQPADPPLATPPAGEIDWEQRARSAEGRVATLSQNLGAQTSRLDQLERLLATMQAQGVQQPETETQQPVEFERLVTDDEERDYGKDMIDMVGRRAAEVVAPEFHQLATRLEKLEGRVNGATTVIAQNETRTVWEQLRQGVGENWQEINHHPLFHQWLDVPDPYAGVPRRQMLMEAFDRHDGPRVLNFFQGFLHEASGTPTNGAQPQPSPSPAQPGNGKMPLEAFAAPGRARSEPQPLAPEKPVYSRASIDKFYADKRRGLWRGREADADAIEADIFRAQHEGRIQ